VSSSSLSLRLFLLSILLLVGLGTGWGFFLDRSLQNELLEREDTRLLEHAQVIRVLLQSSNDESIDLDALTDQVAQASDTRLSIVDPQGWVRGDSALTPAQLENLDQHQDRPEIQAAMAGQTGHASRYSNTLHRDMRYLAIPVTRSGQTWVVRSSAQATQIEGALFKQRRTLFLTGLSGLAVALLMSAIASWQAGSAIDQILIRTHADTLVPPTPGQPAAEALEKAVRSLAQERNRFRAVLEGLDVAVVAVNQKLEIAVVNSAAQRLRRLGEESIGTPLLTALPLPEVRDLLDDEDDRDDDDEAEVIELELPGATLVQLQATRTRKGTVLLFQDVTRLRRLESMRRDFVGNVSHELRTPVAIIRANAETLLDTAIEDGPEPTRMLVGATLRSAKRLGNLITDLLEISRIEAGKMPVRLEALTLARTLAAIQEPMEQLSEDRGVALVTSLVPPDLKLFADPKALQTVLSNLITNGLKYTPDSGKVVLRARTGERTVRIEVHDSGPGIPAEHQERVCERFYRSDKGRSREVGGTGLGLSIVKHMVRAMNGTLGLQDSEELGGACFWIELPKA
jgi:two-component system phosphate regulon sensor histidine kinase PhoR